MPVSLSMLITIILSVYHVCYWIQLKSFSLILLVKIIVNCTEDKQENWPMWMLFSSIHFYPNQNFFLPFSNPENIKYESYKKDISWIWDQAKIPKMQYEKRRKVFAYFSYLSAYSTCLQANQSNCLHQSNSKWWFFFFAWEIKTF